jgi:Domain of unknown function (DUF4249)
MRKMVFILLLFSMCACELTVDVDVPFEQAQLTVNSIFNTDSSWAATISLNRSVFEKDDQPHQLVNDATVIIYDENGNANTLRNMGEGKYVSYTEKPLAGKRYRLQASSPGYEPIESESVAPAPANISKFAIEAQTIQVSDLSQRSELWMSIQFKDNGVEENYYYVFVESQNEMYVPATRTVITKKSPLYIRPNGETEDLDSPIIVETQDLNSQITIIEDGFLIKDDLFNGAEFELSFKSPNCSLCSQITATLYTISKEYYNYISTRYVQDQISGDLFSQPINAYNNITNGFGIFAGISQSISSKDIHPPIIITDITPTQGKPGDEVIITGNFGDHIAAESIILVGFQSEGNNLLYAPPSERSDTQLKVKVPQGAITGKIIAHAFLKGRVTFSDTVFEVVP